MDLYFANEMGILESWSSFTALRLIYEEFDLAELS